MAVYAGISNTPPPDLIAMRKNLHYVRLSDGSTKNLILVSEKQPGYRCDLFYGKWTDKEATKLFKLLYC